MEHRVHFAVAAFGRPSLRNRSRKARESTKEFLAPYQSFPARYPGEVGPARYRMCFPEPRAYCGQSEAMREVAWRARDFINQRYRWGSQHDYSRAGTVHRANGV